MQEIQNYIFTIEDVINEKMVREELETLLHREEIMWAQKGRHNWVIYGDKNTRYFQTVVKQRSRNRIV